MMGSTLPPADWRTALLRGMEMHQRGRLEEAVGHYREALRIRSDCFDALRLLGAALRDQSRHEDAIHALRAALALRGDYEEVWRHLAGVFERLGRLTEAAATWSDWGTRLLREGKPDVGRVAFDRAVALAPDNAACWNNRAVALLALGNLEGALENFDAALLRDPGDPSTWCARGLALVQSGRAADAVASYERAISLAPGSADAWIGLSGAYRLKGDLDESLAASAAAVRIDPESSAAWTAQGASLNELRNFEAAMACHNRALSLSPQNLQARFNLSLAQLFMGDFVAGFRNYEARPAVQVRTPYDGIPIWLGAEPLDGRSLLVLAEQGLGDTIQFSRYLPGLVAAGARVTLMVQPSLRRLLATSLPEVTVLEFGAAAAPFDFRCWLLSLPARYATSAESLPASVPYLSVDDACGSAWDAMLSAPSSAGRRNRHVGIVCSGSARNPYDLSRNIALRRFKPLIDSLAGVCRFHLIQNCLRDEGDESALRELGIADHRAQLTDLAEAAALISRMDAVVSVDSGPAHLAGALGVPVLLLISTIGDWRWMLRRDDSPWYPGLRIFRQASPGRWDDVLAAAALELTLRFADVGRI